MIELGPDGRENIGSTRHKAMRASVKTESALRSHSVRIYTLAFYISFVNYRVEPVLASKTV